MQRAFGIAVVKGLVVASAHKCAYNIPVRYEWDEINAKRNETKHGVDFADAITVLDDELALTIVDDDAPEERFITIGVDALGRILVVVYTWDDETIRLISAREATRHERRQHRGE